MSIVAIQLGQCGNQVGREVFDTICTDLHSSQGFCSKKENDSYQAACKERFFEEKDGGMVARAVLVDMEPKVINQTLSFASRTGNWSYSPQSAFCQKQGSGNNWAHGYCVHGPKHEDAIMNLVQKEAEKCDRLGGFLTIMSMAGGTGSGLGAFVTAVLREAYPNSFLLNHVIWPYGTGEVIVQNYNSVLTLSHLYQSSDALLVHENDAVHKICLQLMKIKQISFQDVNRAIAHQLGSVFQPAYSSEGAAHYSRSPLGDLMEALVPHPEFKMLGLRNIPQMSENSLAYTTFAWPALLKHLRQMLIANAKMEEGIDWQVRPPTSRAPAAEKPSSNRTVNFNTSIANLVTLRGKEVQCADLGRLGKSQMTIVGCHNCPQYKLVAKRRTFVQVTVGLPQCRGFQDPALYTSWLHPPQALNIWKTPRAFNKYEKSASLVSNSQFLLHPLNSLVGKAWKMFASKAYIHQYSKFGIEEDDFLSCFTTLEQVIASYSSL